MQARGILGRFGTLCNPPVDVSMTALEETTKGGPSTWLVEMQTI